MTGPNFVVGLTILTIFWCAGVMPYFAYLLATGKVDPGRQRGVGNYLRPVTVFSLLKRPFSSFFAAYLCLTYVGVIPAWLWADRALTQYASRKGAE